MRSRLAAALLVLACAACDRPDPDRPRPAATPGPPAFVGVWAAQPELCGRTVWRLSPTALVAESGAACLIENLRADAGGWTGGVRCADAPPGVISLRHAEAPRETLVVSAPFSAVPINLVRCPGPTEALNRLDPHSFLDRAASVDLQIAAGGDRVTKVAPRGNLLVQAMWIADGRMVKIVEPIKPAVGELNARATRAYYFGPQGELFLIRDPDGAVGLVGGKPVIHYGSSGQVLTEGQVRGVSRPATLLLHAETVRKMAETLSPEAADGDTAGSGTAARAPRSSGAAN